MTDYRKECWLDLLRHCNVVSSRLYWGAHRRVKGARIVGLVRLFLVNLYSPRSGALGTKIGNDRGACPSSCLGSFCPF